MLLIKFIRLFSLKAQVENVTVSDQESTVHIFFTPTIPHCSMATLIGLCLRVKLLRSLPNRFKISIAITPGTHQSELAGKMAAKILK